MRYREVLSQAYSLTIRNPLLWLFGLVMLGGFNLSLINFFSVWPRGESTSWPLVPGGVFDFAPMDMFAVFAIAIATFIILNLIKIIFIVVAHKFIHSGQTTECDLCVRVKRQAENSASVGPKTFESLPYFDWLVKVLIGSAITIALTVGITLLANAVLSTGSYDTPAAIMLNLMFIAATACVIGTWNVFTSYFIVLHGLGFPAASSAAIDLIVKHARRVLEFVILVSIIYSFSVMIGNAFIHVWHFGFLGEAVMYVRMLFLAVFLLWFAINNAFFNLAFLIFFDRTVKATPVEAEAQPVTQTQ